MCWILYPAHFIQILYQQNHRNDQPATSLSGVVQTKLKSNKKTPQALNNASATQQLILFFLIRMENIVLTREYTIFSEAKDRNSLRFLNEN